MKNTAVQANKTLKEACIAGLFLKGEEAKQYNLFPAQRQQLVERALQAYDGMHKRDREANLVKHDFSEWVWTESVKWNTDPFFLFVSD